MAGRPLIQESALVADHYAGLESAIRRRVLRETIERFENCPDGDRYQRRALTNLAHWQAESQPSSNPHTILVLPGDWGVVTHTLTKQFGACFAVLNMANAFVPGGAYVEGAVAQEENMYRRTDCHFSILPPHYDAALDRYTPAATRLIAGEEGVVYLDVERPRVCIRGPEDRNAADLGYRWLDEHEIFPFFELKAAAQDLRGGDAFDADKARRQIKAQLATLKLANVRHVVLGAFGCGAFRNPADQVARIYREELAQYSTFLDVVAFAIFHAGYGPDNFTPFKAEFDVH